MGASAPGKQLKNDMPRAKLLCESQPKTQHVKSPSKAPDPLADLISPTPKGLLLARPSGWVGGPSGFGIGSVEGMRNAFVSFGLFGVGSGSLILN